MEKNTENTAKLEKLGTRQITTVGMLSAITVILGLTGYGFVPLPMCKATIMHIPVIIGAILEGPKVGALIGLMFGIFSIIQNIITPNILSFAFLNPLISVLPRVLIGLTSYYTYSAIAKRSKSTTAQSFKIAVGSAVGSLTNTVGVLGMIYLIYAQRYAQVQKITVSAAGKAIFGVAITNGIAEAILAMIITVPIVLAVRKVRK